LVGVHRCFLCPLISIVLFHRHSPLVTYHIQWNTVGCSEGTPATHLLRFHF
jgi:hypothetical protein